MKYAKILEKGKYTLIARKEDLDEYAVVYDLDEKNGEWAYTVCYWYFGKYSSLDQLTALQYAIDYFKAKTEENYISRSRLEELATQFKDGLIEDDKESAMEYFVEQCEMTDYEMEFFGIEMESEEEDLW